jgi:hypothetical protein
MMFKRWSGGGDRGNMPMAMLVVTVGLVSSALLTPIVLRQFASTRSLVDRNNELNAAQAGIDVMMARVRAASADDTTNGVVGLLEDLPPCDLTGNAAASGTTESLAWQVHIVYYDADGNSLSSTTCPPYTVPTTATVTSTGYSTSGASRTLTATYVFTTSNTHIPGGGIHIDTSSAGILCLDAGSAKSPAAGTKITMQVCNGSARQQFGYTSDLYLKLVNSESTTAGFGMCLYAGTPSATHASGNFLNFQVCPSTRTGLFQWSLDGSSQFHSTSSSQGIESLCVNVQTPGSIGSSVVLGSCGVSLTTDIFRSDTGVGAGMAGDATNQLVNYAQFSRCLDVTSQNTSSTYMIAWFCKQSPTGGVDWNQQWVHPTPIAPAVSATGNIVVTSSGVKYCLKSPLSIAASVYATVTACPNGSTSAATTVTTASLLWTVYHDTGDYGTSYRIMDSSGYCLTPTDQNAVPKDVHADGTSKVKVTTCSTNELQKWDAPPNINKPTPLTNVTER